ncbi:NADPH-dependent FMN reductase [Acuticoccus sediminis]|uniref:NADPH-dependent FMN reductase n=1 Tax=Acuticoccus sediminis TaxID=2184697 RepID=UPI001CFD6DB8|nr:NAD(P)H-dependent oxidoreductase [Acuticoccus sediminis]
MKTVTVLVGSERKGSINLALARAIEKLAAGRMKFKFIPLGDLPMYNDDLWATPPASVVAFKEVIAQSEAILFVTPEYNRTIPPLLANAISWASKPYGKNVWVGKPVAITGTTPGALGTAVAQSHLRYVATVLDMIVLGQPEVYFQMKPGLIDENADVTDETTRAFLQAFVDKFDAFLDRVALPVAETA